VTIAASIGMAIYAGLSGVIAGAVIFGIWAGLLLLYFFLVRSRIPFAIEMLYTAVPFLLPFLTHHHPGPLFSPMTFSICGHLPLT